MLVLVLAGLEVVLRLCIHAIEKTLSHTRTHAQLAELSLDERNNWSQIPQP